MEFEKLRKENNLKAIKYLKSNFAEAQNAKRTLFSEEILQLRSKDWNNFVPELCQIAIKLTLFLDDESKYKLKELGFRSDQFKWFISKESIEKVLNNILNDRSNGFSVYVNPAIAYEVIFTHLTFKLINSFYKDSFEPEKKINHRTEYNKLSTQIYDGLAQTKPSEYNHVPSGKKINGLSSSVFINYRTFPSIPSVGQRRQLMGILFKLVQGKTEKIILPHLVNGENGALALLDLGANKKSKRNIILKLSPLFMLILPDLVQSEELFDNSPLKREHGYKNYTEYKIKTIESLLRSYKSKKEIT